MIGRLRGEILLKHAPHLMLEVNGVGYELEAPMSTFYHLPAVGETVALYTHLMIRDDAHVLYGFAEDAERILFRALLKVSGVGAKVALAILSGMSTGEFSRCVADNDTASLVRLPGIGKRTAERLIVEMRDRLDKVGLASPGPEGKAPAAAVEPVDSAIADAAEALVSLGYRPADAGRMVRAVDAKGLSSEEIIRAALRNTRGKG